MKTMKLVLAALALGVAATPATAAKKQEMTPLAIQALQLREFEASPRTLFRSVVSVFQDLGYTIDQADFDSGLITASSATKNKTNFWNALGGVAASGNTRATATVEELANGRSSVRLNFVSSKSSSSWYGQSSKNDKPILEAKVYQAAFEKIEEALFVRQATNAPVAAATARPADPQNAAAAVSPAPSSATPDSSLSPTVATPEPTEPPSSEPK